MSLSFHMGGDRILGSLKEKEKGQWAGGGGHPSSHLSSESKKGQRSPSELFADFPPSHSSPIEWCERGKVSGLCVPFVPQVTAGR